MTTLLSFHVQLGNAWKLFLHRWGSAVALQLLHLIPGVLLFPFTSEYIAAVQSGIDPIYVFENSPNVPLFVLGFILLILTGVFVAAATGILFAAQEKLSLGRVLASAIGRYIPVLYTSILSALAVIISLIPALALNYWYRMFAQAGAPLDLGGIAAVDAIVLIAIVALLIPAVIVATWVMYAPLAVALKAAPAGMTALMFTKHVVHRHVWQIMWRIIGSMALFKIVSGSVESLPYASYIVPFALSIIIIAFFVELYKELQGGELYGK